MVRKNRLNTSLSSNIAECTATSSCYTAITIAWWVGYSVCYWYPSRCYAHVRVIMCWKLCFQRRGIRRCWTRFTYPLSASRSAVSAAGTAANWPRTWSALATQKVVATRVRATPAVRWCVELTAAGDCTAWRAGARNAPPLTSRASTPA